MLKAPIFLATAILIGSGCANNRRSCSGRQGAKCAWMEAVGESTLPTDGEGGEPVRRTTVELAGDADGWSGVERILAKMAVLMADGMGAKVTDTEARAFCSDAPTGDAKDAGSTKAHAWFCKPSESASIDGHELLLEVGTDGVIALTARPLSSDEVDDAAKLAELRWVDWCVGPFRERGDSGKSMRARTCPLPGGPTLAIVRIPRDESGGQWQLSLAVMPAG